MKSIKAFLSGQKARLKEFTKMQKVLFFACVFMMALYIFSVFAFSARAGWNYVNLGIGALLIVMVAAYAFFYEELRLDEYALLLFVFCLLTVFSTLMAGRIGSLPKSLHLQAVFGLVVYQFTKNRENFKWAILAILVGGFAFCVYYGIHYRSALFHLNLLNVDGRMGEFFDNENNVARDFVLLSVISFYLAVGKKQWYMLLYTALTVFLLVTTGSISNLLCLMIALFAVLLFLVKGKKRLFLLAAVAALAVAGIFIIQLPAMSYFQKRLFGMLAAMFGTSGADNSSMERFELARDAFTFFFDSPFFGNGYGYVADHTIGGFAHNNIAETLACFGVMGFIAFEALAVVPLLRLRKEKSSMGALLFGLIIYLLVFQFFLVTFYQKIDHIIYALAFGFVSKDYYGGLYFSAKGKRIHFGFRVNRASPGLKKLSTKVDPVPAPLETDVYKID